jgi:hypothetical protein
MTVMGPAIWLASAQKDTLAGPRCHGGQVANLKEWLVVLGIRKCNLQGRDRNCWGGTEKIICKTIDEKEHKKKAHVVLIFFPCPSECNYGHTIDSTAHSRYRARLPRKKKAKGLIVVGGGGRGAKVHSQARDGNECPEQLVATGTPHENATESPDLLAVIRQCFTSSSQVWSIAFLSKSKKDIYCIEIL